MWHEARRREKATQKLLIDHKKRAEKRREDNRVDPNSLLQVHGIKSKLCIDPNVYKQAANSLVVWQGDKNVTIDRFDVRATLTSIPTGSTDRRLGGRRVTVIDAQESEHMKKLLCYERYRLLMQNDLNKVPEETRIRLVARSEYLTDATMKKLQNNKFGTSGETSLTNSNHQANLPYVKSTKKPGVSISFNYNQMLPPTVSCDSSEVDLETGRSSSSIIDLEDLDNFNLDGVDNLQQKTDEIGEILSRYCLTKEEFDLLVDNEGKEVSTSNIIHDLKKLKEKTKQGLIDELNRRETYGPELPPEKPTAGSSQTAHAPPKSIESPRCNSPVQQPSPNAAWIAFKNGQSSDRDTQRSPPILPPPSPEIKVANLKNLPENQEFQTNSSQLKTDGESMINKSPIEAVTHSQSIRTREEESKHPREQRSRRRAPTPLAYKRHCRSSRSLSRERRSSRRYDNHQQRKRRRSRRSPSNSRSSSCSTSTSTSSSTSTSFSSKSSLSGRSSCCSKSTSSSCTKGYITNDDYSSPKKRSSHRTSRIRSTRRSRYRRKR